MILSLDSKFALKDLGQLHYFLGIQAHHLSSSILLNQEKYIYDLLLKLNMEDLKPAPTPSTIGTHLSLYDGNPLPDPFIYQSTIGAQQYLTNTRPDLA